MIPQHIICGHPLPALVNNWTRGAACRHTTAPIKQKGRKGKIRMKRKGKKEENKGWSGTEEKE